MTIIPRWWDPDTWSWYNLKFDAVALLMISLVSIIFLVLIEMEVKLLFDWMPRLAKKKAKIYRTEAVKLPKDDDVLAEE